MTNKDENFYINHAILPVSGWMDTSTIRNYVPYAPKLIILDCLLFENNSFLRLSSIFFLDGLFKIFDYYSAFFNSYNFVPS